MDGYPSIGCAPCTAARPVTDDARSGRWAGWPRPNAGSTYDRRGRTCRPGAPPPTHRRPCAATPGVPSGPPCGSRVCPRRASRRSPVRWHVGWPTMDDRCRCSTATRSDHICPPDSATVGRTAISTCSRIGWVARLLASHGVVVLVPVIAPYADSRAAVRAIMSPPVCRSPRSTCRPR